MPPSPGKEPKMVKGSKSKDDPEARTSGSCRHMNIMEAEDYAQQLEEILEKFKPEIKNDNSDALAQAISILKDHTTKFTPSMGEVDTETVLQCFSDPTFATLREPLGPKHVQEKDPEGDIPSGDEVLKQILKEKIEAHIQQHCVTLFEVSMVTGYMLAACTNLSSLTKITDETTFRIILAASVRPLVQINIPPSIINHLEDKKVETGKEKERHNSRRHCYLTTTHWPFTGRQIIAQHGYC